VPSGAPRIAHALATGAVVAAILAALGPETGVPAPAAGALAALLAALLPRLGWALAMAGAVAALAAGPAITGADTSVAAVGSAALLLLAALPVPFLLARIPRAWSAPALAPVLGLAGLAGAFPAVAGRAPRMLDRAALGALGAWWLLLAEALTDRTLLLGPAANAHTGTAAQGALSIAADAVADTVGIGLPALLAVWAIAAAVLPWIVRGRILVVDLVAACAWTAGLASATAALIPWLGESVPATEPRGLIAGALVAGVGAVAGARMGHFRDDHPE
jgi:hypothetical protein